MIEVCGLASTWDVHEVADPFGDRGAVGSFRSRFARGGLRLRRPVPLLLRHDPLRRVGTVHACRSTQAGLTIRAVLHPGLCLVRGAELSVAFDGATARVSVEDGVAVVEEADLREVSLVPHGACGPLARITGWRVVW